MMYFFRGSVMALKLMQSITLFLLAAYIYNDDKQSKNKKSKF